MEQKLQQAVVTQTIFVLWINSLFVEVSMGDMFIICSIDKTMPVLSLSLQVCNLFFIAL